MHPHDLPSAQHLARLLGGIASGNEIRAPGPGHSPQDRSLSIRLDPSAPDGLLVHSFAGDDPLVCKDHVFDRLGIDRTVSRGPDPLASMSAAARSAAPTPSEHDSSAPAALESEHVYEDAHGTPYLLVRKYRRANGDKHFIQYRREGAIWVAGAPKGPKIPYRLPELCKAVHDVVFLCEGEKDVDNLTARGFVATTNAGGAGNFHSDLVPYFEGKEVFVLEDNDKAGRDRSMKVAPMLVGVARCVRVVCLPGLPERGDVTDWLAMGNDTRGLIDLCRSVPEWGAQQAGPGVLLEDAPILDLWDEYVVPAFPLEVLPTGIAHWIVAQSRSIGCDPSALAMAALASFSAALDHRFSLKMMRHGAWHVSPRLWVLLVGDPSRKKTPVISAATRELDREQNALWDEYERAYATYRRDKEDGDKSAEEPVKPPRYVVGDTTVEKLGEILSRYDRGVLIKRDEFSGWIGALEKYAGTGKGSSADRAFWLQAFDGGPFTVDRISRGELRIRNLSVSFIGGIQPGRLAELRGLTSDGLLQRFLPVMMMAGTFPKDEPSNEPVNGYGRLTRALLSAKAADLIMSDEAHDVAAELRRELFDLEQAAGGLAEGFQAFLGKLAGLFGSVALILHMMHQPEFGNCERVDRGTVEKAARLVREFALPHAFEFYRSSEAVTDGDKLQKIGSYLLTSGKERVLASDLCSNVASLKGASLFEVNKRVSPLVAGGWLQPLEPGPQARSWAILPGVRAALSARSAQEEARKAQLAELMNSGRKRRAW